MVISTVMPAFDNSTVSTRVSYSTTGFALQMMFSGCMCVLEYLEVMNLYNCERWFCGATPVSVLVLQVVLAFCFPENREFSILLVLVHALGAIALLFWSAEWWNTFTRHRTEYYDTHDTYFAMMFFANVFIAFRFYDRKTEAERMQQVVSDVLHSIAMHDCSVVMDAVVSPTIKVEAGFQPPEITVIDITEGTEPAISKASIPENQMPDA